MIVNVKYKDTQYEVLIDDEDFHKIKDFKLRISSSRGVLSVYIERLTPVALHRFILECPKFKIKPLDGNFLNCIKSNLEIITPEVSLKKRMNYRKVNSKAISAKSALWQKNNPDKRKAFEKEYRQSDVYKAGQKKYRQKPKTKTHYNDYYTVKRKDDHYRFMRAKCRGFKGDQSQFTIEEALYIELINRPCTYCFKSILGSGTGLDRIDNTRGYHADNVLPCCGDCNRTRGDRYTVDETKVIISALLKFREEKK